MERVGVLSNMAVDRDTLLAGSSPPIVRRSPLRQAAYMLRRRTLLAASLPALASLGCSKVIEVIVSWNGAIPTFQFRDPGALFGAECGVL